MPFCTTAQYDKMEKSCCGPTVNIKIALCTSIFTLAASCSADDCDASPPPSAVSLAVISSIERRNDLPLLLLLLYRNRSKTVSQ